MILKKPQYMLYAIIIAYLIVLFFVAYFFNFKFSDWHLDNWDKSILHFAQAKNAALSRTFFENADELSKYQNLNYDFLKESYSLEATLPNIVRVGFMIYDVHGEILLSYRMRGREGVFSDEEVTAQVADKINLNEAEALKAHSKDGTELRLGVVPLLTQQQKHFVTIVYIYDINALVNMGFGTQTFYGISAIIFLSLLGIQLLSNAMYSGYIRNIANFLKYSMFYKGQKNPHTLLFGKPFDELARNIAFLLSQKNEIEARYTSLEDKFDYLLAMSSEGIVMEDENGFISFCNKQFADILEYEDETMLLNTRFTDYFHDAKAIEVYTQEVKQRKHNEQYSYKLKLRAKTGIQINCILTGNAEYNDKDEAIGYYNKIVNISDDSTRDASAIEKQYLRSEFFSKNYHPIIILDEHNTIIDANETFINYMQKAKSEIIDKPFEKVIFGMEIEKTYGSGNDDIEFNEPTNNRWYYVTTREANIDLKSYKMIVMYDVGRSKAKEQYQKLILDDSKTFFFIVNRQNQQIVYLSPSFSKITHNSELWFKNYYSSRTKSKTLNILENIVIVQNQNKYEFVINPIYTDDTTMLIYQATLK